MPAATTIASAARSRSVVAEAGDNDDMQPPISDACTGDPDTVPGTLLVLDSDSDDHDGDAMEPGRNSAVHRLSLAAWRVHCARETMWRIEVAVARARGTLRGRGTAWHRVPFLVTATARLASLAGVDPPPPPVSDADVLRMLGGRGGAAAALLPSEAAVRIELALASTSSALADRVSLCAGLGTVSLRFLADLVAFLEWFCAPAHRAPYRAQ